MSEPQRIARVRNIRYEIVGYLWRGESGELSFCVGEEAKSEVARKPEEIRKAIMESKPGDHPWMNPRWTWDAILPEATPEEAALIRLDMLTREDDRGKEKK